MTGSIADRLPTILHHRFYDEYWRYFTVVAADAVPLTEACLSLCREVFGGGHDLDRSAAARAATYFALYHNATGVLAGTVRVALPQAEGAHFTLPELGRRLRGRTDAVCEISRLCMAAQFRKRAGDGHILPAYAEQQTGGDLMPLARAIVGRRVTYAPLGLFMAAFHAALRHGVENAVSLFDPADLPSLKRIGLSYKVLGGRLDWHGPQQPILYNIPLALAAMERVNPECWEIVSDRGALMNTAALPDRSNGIAATMPA